MKKNMQTIVLALAICTLNVSCSIAQNQDRKVHISNETSLTNKTPELLSITGNSDKTATDQINDAQKEKKTVLLVVYKKLDEAKDKALKIANETSVIKAETIEVIEMNASESENIELVKKFRLAGAPMPIIIIIDKNGIPVGGLPLAQATADALLDIIPSPKYSEVLKALNEKKSIFVVAYKKTMNGKSKAIDVCKEAVTKIKDNAIILELNIDDKSEIKLINELKVNILSPEPVIYVINQQGQITDTFTGSSTSDELVVAAKKVISGGCCPDGSKKGGC
jgi:hypothetical protein